MIRETYYCDRCGKAILDTFRVLELTARTCSGGSETFHVCPECVDQLRDWAYMRGKFDGANGDGGPGV